MEPLGLHPDVAPDQHVVQHGHVLEEADVLVGAGDAELGHLRAAASPTMSMPSNVDRASEVGA